MLRISNGQTIANYQVEAFLGRGAFTQVFLVSDAQGNHWAMKLGDDSGGGKNLPPFGCLLSPSDAADDSLRFCLGRRGLLH